MTKANKRLRHCMHGPLLLAVFALTSMQSIAHGINEKGSIATTRFANGPVKGVVTDSKKAPLEGVTITVRGSLKGTTTNAKGEFALDNVADNAVLIFTFTGFANKEYSVSKGRTGVTVALTEQPSVLADVVVVGYGTQTKKDLTGAVAQVKATQLENQNPRSVQDLLRGNVAGLDVGMDASTKGSNAGLLVRGKASLNASTSPLIVVDGVIYNGGLEDVNPNDIETVDVLKDASSAAVFGARSANGVILITTKKGKGSKPTITFNSNIGMNKIEQKPHLLDGNELIAFRQDYEAASKYWFIPGLAGTVGAVKGDSISSPGIQYYFKDPRTNPGGLTTAQWMALGGGATSGDPVSVWLNRLEFKAIEVNNYLANKMLNWENLMYNDNSLQHDHTVSIAGKKENMSYYYSMGYLTNEGLTVNDKYSTFRTRINVEAVANKFMTVGMNVQYSNRDQSPITVSLSDMQQTTPWGSYMSDDGLTLRLSPNDDPGNNTHPFMEQTYAKRMVKYDNIFASAYVKGKLPLGFSYQVNFTPRLDNYRYLYQRSSLDPTVSARKGIVDRNSSTTYQWQLDNILRWNGSFGKHNFEVTGLVNAEKFQSWSQNIHAENFAPNDNLGYNNIGAATLPPVVGSDDQYSTADALMGRLNYNFNKRYYLTTTIRRDGYSAFGAKNTRANFPSAALSWAVNEEKFMKGTEKWLDYLKARVSYGQNGNREIGRYAALAQLASNKYGFVNSSGAFTGVSTVSTTTMANPNLKWERNESMNFGIDYAIFGSKLSGSFDYYIRDTKDLLMSRTLPSVSGFSSVLSNLGAVQNRGFEVTMNAGIMKKRNFIWNTSVSWWTNKNEIKHLYGAVPTYDAAGKVTGYVEKDDLANGWFIGKNINVIYDYPISGVWQVDDIAQAKSFGYKPGDFKLKDTNGDGKYDINDKGFLGNTTPSFSFNVRNEFKIFKSFDIAISLYSRMGQYSQLNEAKNVDKFYNRSNFYVRPYWTPSNPINDYAAINSNAAGAVNWNVWRKSSFIRLNNISLAYSLPSDLCKKMKFENAKVYLNAVNPYVFSTWKYFDPENKGITPITYNFGINLTL